MNPNDPFPKLQFSNGTQIDISLSSNKTKDFFFLCIPVPGMSISTISRHKIARSYTQIYKPPFCNSKRNTILYTKFHPFAECMHTEIEYI